MDFTIGDAIAALGLVAAVYGLAKPTWRLNLYLNWRFGLSVITLVALGVLAPFVAYSLRPLNLPYMDIVDGLAWVLFVCAAIDLVRCVFWTRPIYRRSASEKAKERFIRCVLDWALLSDMESLNAVITILGYNLDEICADVHSYRHYEDDEEPSRDVAAYLLVTFLGESKVINHIAESRIDFILNLIASLKEHHVGKESITNATGSLMSALYTNPKSYLYQQLGYDGLTNYASIYHAIFEDDYFVSTHNPISTWYGLEHQISFKDEALINPRYVQVFLKGYVLALKKFAYVNSGQNMQDQLRLGMHGLSEYARDLSMDMHIKGDKDFFSPSGQAFNKVMHFVSNSFYWDVFSKKAEAGLISSDELNPPLETDEWTEGLSAAFARLYYNTIEAISAIHGPTESERMTVLRVDEVFLSQFQHGQNTEGIRKKVLHLLWDKSEENIVHGWFPVVFRALAILVYWRHSSSPAWALEERNKMIDTLRTKIKPRILRNEMMANRETPKEEALLPECFKFDRATGKFYSVDASDNRTELRKTSAPRPRPSGASGAPPRPVVTQA